MSTRSDRQSEGLVGEAGFEPAISCSQSTCVSQLRHSPVTTPGNRIGPADMPVGKPTTPLLQMRQGGACDALDGLRILLESRPDKTDEGGRCGKPGQS